MTPRLLADLARMVDVEAEHAFARVRGPEDHAGLEEAQRLDVIAGEVGLRARAAAGYALSDRASRRPLGPG